MGRDLTNRARKTVAQREGKAPEPIDEEHKGQNIFQAITAVQGQLERALPKHMDADRIARLAITAIRKNSDLRLCTPVSFAGALLTTSALGLEPEVNGESYLVPYREHGVWQCQLIVGYQGYAKLFYQSPVGSHLAAHPVYEADEFDFEYGTNQFVRHKPSRLSVEDRGEVIYYYASARMTTGSSHFEVLTADEVKNLRRGKVGPKGNIPDPQRWMERKTVVRQVVKLLPKSPRLASAAAVDERFGQDLYRDRMAERGAEDDLIDLTPEHVSDTEDTTDEAAPAANDTTN